MVFQKRGAHVEDLRLDLRFLFLEPLDHRRCHDITHGLGIATGGQGGAHIFGARFGGRPFTAHAGQLDGNVIQLLIGQRIGFARRQQVRIRTVGGNLLLGFLDLVAQAGDFRLQPARCFRTGVELCATLPGQIDIRHLVGDRCGNLRITGGKFDTDDARTRCLVDGQLFAERFQNAIFRRQRIRVLLQMRRDHQLADQRIVAAELFHVIELQIAGDLLDQVGGLEKLDLAGDGQFIGRRCPLPVIGRVFDGQRARLHQNTGLALELFFKRAGTDEGKTGRNERYRKNARLALPNGAEELDEVNIHILIVSGNARHAVLQRTLWAKP